MQILADLCEWMDANGSLATLRHGFRCYGRTLRVAYFKAAHELSPEMAADFPFQRTIALLKERRAALIAAAVTGQIDVEAAA